MPTHEDLSPVLEGMFAPHGDPIGRESEETMA
jgi:hypothetical protein